MKIEVIGPGCARCKKLMENTIQAIGELGVDATVSKVEDLREMMKFKVMATPALAIDGTVKSAGRVLTPDEVKALLRS